MQYPGYLMRVVTPLPALPGDYILVIETQRPLQLEVGALGRIRFDQGCHLYVGSARGPGGIAARVGRHLRKHKALRWHVDYLLNEAPVVAVWYACGSEPREGCWVERLNGWRPPVLGSVPGFGASDSRAESHLFHARMEPRAGALRRLLGLSAERLRYLRIRPNRGPAT